MAIIATPSDRGAVPQLFGHPQRYAHFLEQELSVHRNAPLLTMMPAGYGTAAAGPRAAAITDRLPHPSDADAMASQSVTAVEQPAAANGHRVNTTARPPSANPRALRSSCSRRSSPSR